MATAPGHNKHQRIRLVQPDEDRPIGAPRRPVSPLVLWLGVLGGPVAYVIVRVAGLVLLAGQCTHPAGSTTLLGLTSSQLLVSAITIMCAFSAGAAAVVSWHTWRRSRLRDEELSGESMRTTPFWAMGGIFLGAVFFIAIVFTGALAIDLSAVCTS